MKMKSAVVVALATVVVGVSGMAMAFDRPCKEAREKFCKDVKMGDGAVMKCLLTHSDQLSPECKAAIAEKMKEKAQK